MIRKRAGRRAHERARRRRLLHREPVVEDVVYKGLLLPERLDAFYLDLATTRRWSRSSRSSTRASARTRSPRGSARTRTGASRTTARSTRCAATRRGCARARRCSRATRSASTSPTSSRSSGPAAATRRRSTTWSTSSSPAGAAAARDDDARARGVGQSDPDMPAERDARSTSTTRRSSSRGTGRRRSPSPTACYVGATLDRNGLRPAKYVVTDERLRRRGERARRARLRPGGRRREGARCSRARCSSSTPTRGRLVGDEEIKHEVAARKPYATWLDEQQARRSRSLPEAPTPVPAMTPTSARRLQRAFGYTREDLKRAARADGGERRGADGQHGQRRAARGAERAAAAALPLLQAAVRAGHQPADRSDPRGARHDARELRRRRGQPARGDAASSAACSSCRTRCSRTTSWRSSSASTLGDFRRARAAARCSTPASGDARDAGRALERAPRRAVRRRGEGCRRAARSILVLSDRGVDRASTRPSRACSRRAPCTTP